MKTRIIKTVHCYAPSDEDMKKCDICASGWGKLRSIYSGEFVHQIPTNKPNMLQTVRCEAA